MFRLQDFGTDLVGSRPSLKGKACDRQAGLIQLTMDRFAVSRIFRLEIRRERTEQAQAQDAGRTRENQARCAVTAALRVLRPPGIRTREARRFAAAPRSIKGACEGRASSQAPRGFRVGTGSPARRGGELEHAASETPSCRVRDGPETEPRRRPCGADAVSSFSGDWSIP